MLEQLLSYVKNQTPSSVAPARNIYDEFFEVPHKCHPNEASEFTFPLLPTIKEFLDALDQKSSNKPWLSGQSGHLTASTQEKKDWMYKILTQDCFDGPVVSLRFRLLKFTRTTFHRRQVLWAPSKLRVQILFYFTARVFLLFSEQFFCLDFLCIARKLVALTYCPFPAFI